MIKVYSTPSCPYCKLAKDYLNEKGLAFVEINVADDAEMAKEVVKLSGQMGVPVIDIDGQIIVGWNKSALEEVLAMKPQMAA